MKAYVPARPETREIWRNRLIVPFGYGKVNRPGAQFRVDVSGRHTVVRSVSVFFCPRGPLRGAAFMIPVRITRRGALSVRHLSVCLSFADFSFPVHFRTCPAPFRFRIML
jgi:hypothetical protein